MMHFSQSEEDGLQLIRSEDRAILSIGISTGGTAEIRMVEGRPDRTVKATTLDAEGADLVREKIAGLGLTGQIAVCVEDVVQPIIPGKVSKYDYVYARLVLHYLTKQQLPIALVHIAQQLKLNGRLFIVVRSTGCQECQPKNIVN